MKIELVAATSPRIDVNPEDFTAYIARIGRVKSNPDRLLKYLIEHAHWSPFEHTFLTFKIETSRAIGRELLRHRSFTFQELSQRYETPLGFEPIETRMQCVKNRQSSTDYCDPLITYEGKEQCASEAITHFLHHARTLYETLLAAGIARECARFMLPEATTTTILMTGSLRSWIHFLAIRDHADAQKEARTVAQEIKKIFIAEFPAISAAAFQQKPEEIPKVTEQVVHLNTP
jgi:thymidylate synthase (FAD)